MTLLQFTTESHSERILKIGQHFGEVTDKSIVTRFFLTHSVHLRVTLYFVTHFALTLLLVYTCSY